MKGLRWMLLVGLASVWSQGVTAKQHVSFPVANEGDTVYTELEPGAPATGWVTGGNARYFRLGLEGGKGNPQYSHVDFSLTSTVGDVDLYISLDSGNSNPPGPDNAQYWSLTGGTDYANVRVGDVYWQQWCGNEKVCVMRVGVVGWLFSPNSSFILTATPNDNSTELVPGVAHFDHASSGTYNYYKLDVPAVAPGKEAPIVTFYVTAFSGDPDLFESASVERPDQAHHDRASQSVGREVITITEGSSGWCTPPCTLYASVLAYQSNATYTITGVVDAEAAVPLILGQSQLGYSGQKDLSEYKFTVPGGPSGATGVAGQISVTVSTLLGDADLYLTLDGSHATTSHYQRASVHTGAALETIVVHPSDSDWLQYCGTAGQDCVVHVGVYGFQSSFFTVLATTSSTATRLQENVPVQGMVGEGQYAYFELVLPSGPPSQELIFQVSTMSGDADIAVTNSNSSITEPTIQAGHYDWIGLDFGSDAVEIFPSDPKAQACGTPCTYYVGIYGVFNSSFSLVARERDSTPTQLLPGVSLNDGANNSVPNYYFTFLQQNATAVRITVSPMSGDPDLFVQLGGDPRTTHPTRGTADYISDSPSGNEAIIVRRSSAIVENKCKSFFDANTDCPISITVESFSDSTRYSIVASPADGITDLPENSRIAGTVASHQYVYYRYRIDSPYAITIAVTPFQGDPDIYVSIQDPRPTRDPGHYNWTSQGAGQETLTIAEDDPAIEKWLNENHGYPIYLYIGVYGWSTDAVFTIIGGRGLFMLSQGYPIQGHASHRTFSNFWIRTPDSDNLNAILSTTSSRGSVDIYLGDTFNGNRPVLPHYDCSSDDDGSCTVSNTFLSSLGSSRLVFPPSNNHFHPTSIYIAGVLCVDSPFQYGCDFTITYSVGDTIQSLQSGVPVDGAVNTDQYAYYRLTTAERGQDVVVTLSNSVGDADLYVSVDPAIPRPSKTNYNFSATSLFEDVLTVPWAAIAKGCPDAAEDVPADEGPRFSSKGRLPPLAPQLRRRLASAMPKHLGDDPIPTSCDVFIAVYGFSDATYSLVAVADSQDPIWLVDGQPQAGSVGKRQYQYYEANVQVNNGDSWYVAVDSTSGNADVLVKLDGSKPSLPDNYDFISRNFGGIDLLAIDQNPTSGTAGIAVYGDIEAEYTITYSTSSIVTSLRSGVAQTAAVGAGKYAYFEIDVPGTPPVEPLFFSSTALTGDVNLYVSVRRDANTRPTTSSFDWQSSGLGQDTLQISDAASNCPTPSFGCSFVVGVYGVPGGPDSVSFTLTARFGQDSMVRLVDGSPARATIAANEYNYYYFQSSSGHRNITISTSTSRGDVEMYISNVAAPGVAPLPSAGDPKSYNWSTADPSHMGGPDSVQILVSDPKRSKDLLGYVIAVYGVSHSSSDYVITASTSEIAEQLTMGQSSSERDLVKYENQHWFVTVSDASQPLSVSVSTLRGSVVLSIARENPYVSCAKDYNGLHCTNATWTTLGATDGSDLISIDPSNPCANAVQGCDPATAWGTGRFYIDVFAETQDATYTILASSRGSQSLRPGKPTLVVASATTPAYLQFLVSADPSKANADVRFVVQRTTPSGSPTGIGPNTAISLASCSGDSCTDSQRYPSPSTATRTVILTGGVAEVLISPSDSDGLWCDSTTTVCGYFAALTPSCTTGCTIHASVTATIQDGTAGTTVPFSSMDQDISSSAGVVPANELAFFELYFSPGDVGPVDVRLNIEVCGDPSPSATSATFGTVYVCDQTSTSPCKDPFSPSGTDYSYKISTGPGSTSPSAQSGLANYIIGHSSAPEMYAAVATASNRRELLSDSSSPSASSGSLSFVFSASAGSTLYLSPGVNAAVAVSKVDGTQVDLSWSAAVITDQNGENSVTATGAFYTVYIAQGLFSDSPSALSSTACGLQLWSQVGNGPAPVVVSPGVTSATVKGLDPDTKYEFTVVASCHGNCWTTSAVRNHRVLYNLQPPHSGQSVALGTSMTFKTGKSATTAPAAHGIPEGGVIALVIVASIGTISLGFFVCWRRRKAADYDAQYSAMDASGQVVTDDQDPAASFFGRMLGSSADNQEDDSGGMYARFDD